jgi:signal transduction histidine kinase
MPSNKKSLYFAFQGLFFSVLTLILAFYPGSAQMSLKLRWIVLSWSGLSLIFLSLSPQAALERWYFQATFFIGDALAASIALFYSSGNSNLDLIYLFIVMGTALTSNWRQSFVIGIISLSLFFSINFASHNLGSSFWLKGIFLVAATALLTLLSLDARRIQKEEEMRKRKWEEAQARLESVSDVAAHLAHQLKGPLSNILVSADILEQRLGPPAASEAKDIREEIWKCRALLSRIIEMGRRESANLTPIDLRTPLKQALRALEPQIRAKKIRPEIIGLEDPLPVLGDAELLEQAFTVLIQNAIESISPNSLGRIRILAHLSGKSLFNWERGSISIQIEDNGCGITMLDRSKLFMPFFTTKKEGTGLGLSSALRIAQKHNATLRAESEGPGRGSRFIFEIPRN